MNNEEDLYTAVSDALKEGNDGDSKDSTTPDVICAYETLQEMLARHRREIRQLNAETTALKKTATKGEKKKKKEILTKVAIMDNELNARHEEELKKHKPQAGDPDNVESAVDEEDDGISLDRLNELTIEEGPVAPTGTPTIGANSGRKKPNRQKQRKERKEAEIQRIKDEAEKEAEGQVDRGKLESDAIKELLVPMQLRVSEVAADGHCLYNAVADQLAVRYKVKTDYKELRKEAAAYIRAHPDDFMPFLYKDDGGMYTADDLKKYCDDLENTAVWGGQLEILALSKVRQVPFYVIQMGSPVLKISEEEFPDRQPIKLA
ncbi:OTU protein [Umbelopsis sp. WA50703]